MGERIELFIEETDKIRKQISLPLIIVEKNELSHGRKDSETSPKEESNHNEKKQLNSNSFHETNEEKLGFRRDLVHDTVSDETKSDPTLLKSAENGLRSKEEDKDDDWLSNIGKPKIKFNAKPIKLSYEEDDESEEDMPIMKLSHDMSDIAYGKNVVLTLKETDTVYGNDGGNDEVDILENDSISQQKADAKNIQLRQMNKDRKRKKMVLNVSSLDIDEEEKVKESDTLLTIGSQLKVGVDKPKEISSAHEGKVKVIFDDPDDDDWPDEGDFKFIKIKKRKKKENNETSQRKKINLPMSINYVELINEDELDDEMNITIQPLRNNMVKSNMKTPDQLALAVARERMEKEQRELHTQSSNSFVIDENVAFIDSLKTNIIESNEPVEEIITDKLEVDANIEKPKDEREISDEVHEDAHNENTKPNFYSGLASTLNFLQDRQLLPKREQSINAKDVERDNLLKLRQNIEVRKVKEQFSKKISESGAEYSSAELDRIKQYENKAVQKKVKEIQDERLSNYNPEVGLTYKDEDGNELTTKEAYKRLSQKFHGTKSNKEKEGKAKAKILARKNQKIERDPFGLMDEK